MHSMPRSAKKIVKSVISKESSDCQSSVIRSLTKVLVIT
jgi:hypothetical protein